MMSRLVIASSLLHLFLLCSSPLFGQVNKIETDEAQDIILNECDDEKMTLFIFRYPDIGDKMPVLQNILAEFNRLNQVTVHEISMIPIPGCTRPKQFELCGFSSLNPYMKYNPYLILFSNQSSVWRDFESSSTFSKNPSLYRKLTDKESQRAPFMVSNDLSSLRMVIDYFQGGGSPSRNSKVRKSSDPLMDSTWILGLILREIEKSRPASKITTEYAEIRVGTFSGQISSPTIQGSSVEVANLELDPGLNVHVAYAMPIGRGIQQADQCYELGFQQTQFRASSRVSQTTYATNTVGISSLFRLVVPISYSKLRFGGGPFLHYRMPIKQTSYTPYYLNNPTIFSASRWNRFDLGISGQIQLELLLFKSSSIVLDYRLSAGLMSMDKDTQDYTIRGSSFSAGIRVPVR